MISRFIIVGWTLFIAYSFFYGLAAVVEGGIDPESGIFAFAFSTSIIVHFVAWMIVALPTYMISRMFRREPSGHAFPDSESDHQTPPISAQASYQLVPRRPAALACQPNRL